MIKKVIYWFFSSAVFTLLPLILFSTLETILALEIKFVQYRTSELLFFVIALSFNTLKNMYECEKIKSDESISFIWLFLLLLIIIASFFYCFLILVNFEPHLLVLLNKNNACNTLYSISIFLSIFCFILCTYIQSRLI